MINLRAKTTKMAKSNSESVWPHLKQGIAKSSGFKRWVVERGLDANDQGGALDNLVRLYLRQALETLAY